MEVHQAAWHRTGIRFALLLLAPRLAPRIKIQRTYVSYGVFFPLTGSLIYQELQEH